MKKDLKGKGGAYSKHHRGSTPPGSGTGPVQKIDHTQEALQRAMSAVCMKPAKAAEGSMKKPRLSKGARRSMRNAKALLRKHGLRAV